MGEAVISDDQVIDIIESQIVIDVGGDIDLASAPRLHQRLLNCFQEMPRRVTVNMSDVSFVDSSALGVLVSARNRALAIDCEFNVVLPTGSARFPFEVTGLTAKFNTTSEVV